MLTENVEHDGSFSSLLALQLLEDAEVKKQTKKGMKMVFGKWVDAGVKWTAKKAKAGREKIKKSGAAGRGFAKGAGWDKKGGHDDHGEKKPKKKDPEDDLPLTTSGKVVKAFGDKMKGAGEAVSKVWGKLGEKAKKVWSDPEYRKKTFSKENISGKIGEAAGKTWSHIKHAGHDAKVAGGAMGKILKSDVKDVGKTWKGLPDNEKAAIKSTIKNVALTVGGTAAMGHMGVGYLAQHFALESMGMATAETAVAAILAHRLQMMQWHLLTEEEQEEAMKGHLKRLHTQVASKMDAFSKMSNDETAKLFAKLADKSKLTEDELFESYFVEASERAAL